MANQTIQKIKEWLELRTFTLEDFIAEKKIKQDQIQKNSKKYKLDDLTMIFKLHDLSAQLFYYPSGKLAVMNIYGKELEQLSAADIFAYYGEPEAEERSRAGKTAHYHVYGKEGFAFSSNSRDNEVHFVDLFPSMTAKEYLELIYLPPGPFIR